MSDFVTVCEKAVCLGAAALMERFGHVQAEYKGPADLVTEADYASQAVIRQTVLDAFPDHCFLGEETIPGGSGSTPMAGSTPTADKGSGNPKSEYRWIVDPLDGTTNYVHQVPHFCVSLALERLGEPVVGCVYNPVSGERFTAAAGDGACLGGEPIRSSSVACLSEALASAGFATAVAPEDPDVKLFLTGLNRCQAIRRTGSAALNMSYLAAGRFDVAWSFCTKVWDVAAGAVLIRESGGLLVDPDGGPFKMETGRFLAAGNARLLEQLLDMASQAGI